MALLETWSSDLVDHLLNILLLQLQVAFPWILGLSSLLPWPLAWSIPSWSCFWQGGCSGSVGMCVVTVSLSWALVEEDVYPLDNCCDDSYLSIPWDGCAGDSRVNCMVVWAACLCALLLCCRWLDIIQPWVFYSCCQVDYLPMMLCWGHLICFKNRLLHWVALILYDVISKALLC